MPRDAAQIGRQGLPLLWHCSIPSSRRLTGSLLALILRASADWVLRFSQRLRESPRPERVGDDVDHRRRLALQRAL
jgi:hypothetical protein